MDLAESLGRSPELFPHTLDARSDAVSFIRLSREEFSNASFLDGRVLSTSTRSAVMPWSQVTAAVDAANLAESCGYVFHIGHVGSTLLSRLVGAHSAAFSLREPLVLRDFAEFRSDPLSSKAKWSHDEYALRLEGCLKLLSRTYHEREITIVKATSFVSELAAELLRRASAPKAIAVFVAPESYLATMFGGPISRKEASILAPSRLRRLHRYLGQNVWDLASLSEGQALAMSWACEMSALARVPAQRILRVNFERFLDDPHAGLHAALRQFGIDATPQDITGILEGPVMRRYSKAPEYGYDAALRREVLNEARRIHGADIGRGLQWLESAAVNFAPIAAALAFASSAVP